MLEGCLSVRLLYVMPVFTPMQGNLSSKAGVWGKKAKPAVLLNAAVVEGAVVTGTQGGQLYAWLGRECFKAVPAHEGPVLTLAHTPQVRVWCWGWSGSVRGVGGKMWCPHDDLVKGTYTHDWWPTPLGRVHRM
jgi:hypothetical protein